MDKPSEPSVPLEAGEYWVWNGKKYELWGSTRVFDGEKFFKIGA